MSDEISIHNDMDKPIRTVINVTAKVVEYYDDIVDFMTKAAVDRYVAKYKEKPNPRQVVFAKREIFKLTIISRDILGAQKVEVPRLST